MPNWCENILEVTGPQTDLDAFARATTTDGTVLSFALLVPEPSHPDPDNPNRDDDIVNWRINTGWGTKWDLDPYDCRHHTDTDVLLWSFPTAWSPPLRWLTHVAKKYPTLTFRLGYDEPGMGFCGIQRYANGHHTPDGSWETGDTLAALPCAVPTCETYLHEDLPSIMDFHSQPTEHDLAIFCEQHALEEAVYRHATRARIH